METPENTIPEKTNKWLHIIITQFICVAIILSTILITKFFFKDTYTELKEWYKTNICNDTDINEILQDGDIDEI